MFTFKFLGLDRQDAPTPYYYGSLPAKPELGQMLVYNEFGNRYVIVRIDGQGLVGGDAYENEKQLAWDDIASGKPVPTLWLQKINMKPVEFRGDPVDPDQILKEQSRRNKRQRLKKK